MKSVALIPVLNEESSVAETVEDALHHVDRVVVVDDGCTDSTASVAEGAGAEVLCLGQNTGKANAVREGLKLTAGYENVVLMDGDGQHLPSEIPLFLEGLKSYDLVVGSRFLKGVEGMPFKSRVSNRVASRLLSSLAGESLTDPQSGFRAIRRSRLVAMELEADKYALEHIMLMEASRKGYTIGEVPISTVYGEEKSHISPLRDTLGVAFNILKFMLRL